MNFSRALLLPVALAAAVALPAIGSAQVAAPAAPAPAPAAGQSGHHHHRGGWGRAMHGITLSDPQKAQIKQLRTAYRQAHPAGSKPDMASRKALRDQITGILTPAQRAQYQTNLQQLRRNEQNEGAEKPGAPEAPDPTASPKA
ncbi:MAG TPA: hypothetical protein VIG32_12375 [Candidatus Baltobacteraceae bacterium]